MLNERRQHILKLVVQEFIDRATPVASESLVKKYGLPISSATVRNELASLEEMGYLVQLHTSAGRVPTDTGYRFFVEHLMESDSLSLSEQGNIYGQFEQARFDVDEWIRLAATVLAQTTNNASVITPPRAYQTRFKHLELVSIHETVVLMVLVLHDGAVDQQTLLLKHKVEQDELRRIADGINEQCQNKPVAAIEQELKKWQQQAVDNVSGKAAGEAKGEIEKTDTPIQQQPDVSLEQQVLELVVHSMRRFESQINEEIRSEGLLEMLSQPEFLPAALKEEDTERAIERIRHMLSILTSTKVLGRLIVQTLASDDVQVVIGGEHTTQEMREYSVVLTRYGVEGTVSGVLGVVGPTRMSYPRSISTVRYTSVVLSKFLRELYGSTPIESEGKEP